MNPPKTILLGPDRLNAGYQRCYQPRPLDRQGPASNRGPDCGLAGTYPSTWQRCCWTVWTSLLSERRYPRF